MAVPDDEALLGFFVGGVTYVESSNVAWIKYDHEAQWLYVGMKHGGIYLYIFTTDEEAEDFARAPSQGKWVWEHCIRSKRPFSRVTVPVAWPSGNEPGVQPTFGTVDQADVI